MARNYDISFEPGPTVGTTSPDIAIISGEISTGKTTVLEFVDYCLGGATHPSHSEVLRQVKSAQLQVELTGNPHVIERAVGEPSTTATVWPGTLDDLSNGTAGPPTRRPIRPPGDPESLSSLLLLHCGLEGVQLREAPTNPESKTDPLSFRDLMWLVFLTNERLDDKNLLFESNHMKALKLRQVVDVVYGVHDYRAVELGQRIDELGRQLAHARTDLAATQRFVEEQQPRARGELEIRAELATSSIAAIDGEIAALDAAAAAATDFAANARQRHAEAAARARRSAALLRDRETLLQRLVPLRAQYAEDVRKLALLAEAHALFDPLRVAVCPACLSRLASAPENINGRCSLCQTELPSVTPAESAPSSNGDSAAEGGSAHDADDVVAATQSLEVAAELRSTQTRLKELVSYVESLDTGVRDIKSRLAVDEQRERSLAAQLDSMTSVAVNPFLAERDALMARRQAAKQEFEEAASGIRLHAGVERRSLQVVLQERNLKVARAQLADLTTNLGDRQQVLAAISQRFGAILSDFRYPKLERPFVGNDLKPNVREQNYTAASSGARTLISLAWFLSIFEVAWERGASHPGFAMIDSPQKNLGANSEAAGEFADSRIVAGIYGHLARWLAGPGAGAQIVLVDNTPPDSVEALVVARFTRDPSSPPYGLIDDEVG